MGAKTPFPPKSVEKKKRRDHCCLEMLTTISENVALIRTAE